MPAALPVPLREQMVRLHEEGHLLVDIAHQLNVRYSTLCSWWRRYGKEGRAGLKPHYERCGRHGPRDPQVQQAALTLKRAHPPWGAGRIRVELLALFPACPLPQVRAMQRWFRAAGLQPVRAQRPAGERQRGKPVHEVWEVDAKEQLRLGDGSPSSVLTGVDEASGALLEATPFPPVSLGPGGAGHGATDHARLV